MRGTITARFAAALAGLAVVASCRSTTGTGELRPAVTTAAMPNVSGPKSSATTPRVRGSTSATGSSGIAEVGAAAPDFELVDAVGRVHRLSQYRGKLVVLEWFDPECPFVGYAYDDGPLSEMETRYAASGIVWLCVYSTRSERAAFAPTLLREFSDRRQSRAPILIDPEGRVAQSFGARTTPHMFLINERGTLVYSGALDNAPMGRVERASAKTNYVESAIGDLRSGHAVTTSSTRPYGSPIALKQP